jgi:hypothetical protein
MFESLNLLYYVFILNERDCLFLIFSERLIEAEKRDYWQSTEQEKNQLRSAYLDMEGRIEENLN